MTYDSLSAYLFEQALDQVDFFQNDQTFSFLSVVQRSFDVLFAEEQTIHSQISQSSQKWWSGTPSCMEIENVVTLALLDVA